MWPNPQFSADLVIFTEEILDGKLHFLCSDKISNKWSFKEHLRFNSLQANVPFLYPVKTSENQRFAYVFRGYFKNGVFIRNGLISIDKFFLKFSTVIKLY